MAHSQCTYRGRVVCDWRWHCLSAGDSSAQTAAGSSGPAVSLPRTWPSKGALWRRFHKTLFESEPEENVDFSPAKFIYAHFLLQYWLIMELCNKIHLDKCLMMDQYQNTLRLPIYVRSSTTNRAPTKKYSLLFL